VGASILIVDDERPLLRVLSAGLEAKGYRTRTALTGATALEAAAVAEPDVTLLDLGLPDLDGIDVCARLRRATNNPIIVLTADGAEDRKIRALDLGADDYVTKPFSMPELLARIRVALRHRRALTPSTPGAPEVIVVGTEELARLGAELLEAHPVAETRERRLVFGTHLVREIGVDRLALALLDQLDEVAQPAANALEHGRRDVLPPLVGLDLLDDLHLRPYHRDRVLLLEQSRDLL
jgi:two-component system KDP operon response regulator KdpE